MRHIILLAGLLGLAWWLPSVVHAQTTHTPATCSYADVNAKVVLAVTGDTVSIPAGLCTWTTTLSLLGKNIHLTGQTDRPTNDECDAPGQTTHTCIKSSVNPIIRNPSTAELPSDVVRISHLNLRNTGSTACAAGAYSMGMINSGGVSPNIRIDHNTITSTICNSLFFINYARGVVDHNKFYIGTGGFWHVSVTLHTIWGTSDPGYGDGSWASSSSIGGANNVFFEDNEFINLHPTLMHYFVDDYKGGRTVYRKNQFTNGIITNHGTDSGGRYRSARHMEAYQNTFSLTLATTTSPVSYRGMGGMAWQNVITGNFTNAANVGYYRSARPPNTGSNAWSYYPWSMCGENAITTLTHSGTTATVTHLENEGGPASTPGSYVTISGATPAVYNGTFRGTRTSSTTFTYPLPSDPGANASGTMIITSPFDGNTDATGYPCLDQMGRGAGTPMFTGDGNPISPVAWPSQEIERSYFWGSTVNGVLKHLTVDWSGTSAVKSNRDFYNENTAFDGASTVGNDATGGVGVGAIASRPATCTTGVAWWATNEGEWDSSHVGVDGKLYVCTSTNTWTAQYGITNSTGLPYPYPHPLVTETVPEPPTAPTGLHIVGTTNANTVCLAWPPSTIDDLGGYHIYHGMTAGVYSEVFSSLSTSVATLHKPATQYCYTSTVAGTHYFSVSAHDIFGVDTDLDTEVSATFTALSRSAASARGGISARGSLP